MVSKKKATGKKAVNSKKPTKSTRQEHRLTHDQMSKSLGISPQAFRLWGVEPVEKQPPFVFYTVADVLANRLAHQAAKLERPSDGASVAERMKAEGDAKLRLTLAQAEGQEIKNAQLRKELAPVSVIEWVIGKAGGQISAILDAIPLQLKKRNPKLTASNLETIRRDIVKAQNAASQMTVDLDEYYDSATDK